MLAVTFTKNIWILDGFEKSIFIKGFEIARPFSFMFINGALKNVYKWILNNGHLYLF